MLQAFKSWAISFSHNVLHHTVIFLTQFNLLPLDIPVPPPKDNVNYTQNGVTYNINTYEDDHVYVDLKVQHEVGVATIHPGAHAHRALDLTSGIECSCCGCRLVH